jgi:hypothetical protein
MSFSGSHRKQAGTAVGKTEHEKRPWVKPVAPVMPGHYHGLSDFDELRKEIKDLKDREYDLQNTVDKLKLELEEGETTHFKSILEIESIQCIFRCYSFSARLA